MNEVNLSVCTVRGNSCVKVTWRNIAIGLTREDDNGKWLYTKDLKGEFWSLHISENKDTAIDQLIAERAKLDDFRLRMITGK